MTINPEPTYSDSPWSARASAVVKRAWQVFIAALYRWLNQDVPPWDDPW